MTVTTSHSATGPQEATELLPDLAPEEIDAGFAACPRDSVVSTRFDNEILLVDRLSGRMHVLNSTGALVWEYLDGEVTLDELAADLADAFAAPIETVRADIVEMTRELGYLGLVAGVSPPAQSPTPMLGLLEVGDQMDSIPVMASDGSEVQLPYLNKGTLLVNWSPFCGYCAMIEAELAGCRPGLVERDIALALLTVGSAEDNDRILSPNGLSDAAFYRRQPSGSDKPSDSDQQARHDPFASLGTPTAYLLDLDGRVSEPLAYGSGNVVTLVRKTAGLAPVPVEVEGDQPGAPRKSLPAASGVCGPSAIQLGKKPRQWAITSAYEIGEFQVGIRADSFATDDLLARAFGEYRLGEATSAPDNFSIVLESDSGTGKRALSLLLAADATVVRSRSPRRILCALRARLSALLEPDTEGLIATTNVAALVGDQAVLLPPTAMYWMEYLQARLARLGVRLSDEPRCLVDPDKQELVIPAPLVQITPAVLAELPAVAPSRTELAPIEPGRYQLAAWTFEYEPSRSSAALTRASAVAGILPAVIGSPEMLSEAITAIGHLLEQTRAVPLQSTSQQDLMKSIEERVLRTLLGPM